MNFLVKNATVLCAASKHDNKVVDLRIVDGKITEIGKITQQDGEEVFDVETAFLALGFFDMKLCVWRSRF